MCGIAGILCDDIDLRQEKKMIWQVSNSLKMRGPDARGEYVSRNAVLVHRRLSIIDPEIDVLLDETDNDRFLLCALASKRAHDINDMMRGQRDRAIQLSSAVEIAKANHVKPLSMAFAEIARGEVSFDPETIDIKEH